MGRPRRMPRLQGACPKCGKLPTRIGCKCVPPPADFPRRDRAAQVWVNPVTGEVVAPAPAEDPPPDQLALIDLGEADRAREGVAALRAALDGRRRRARR